MSQSQTGLPYYEMSGKMFCSQCGKELKQGATFCNGCGRQVNAPTLSPPQPTTQASYQPTQRPASSTIAFNNSPMQSQPSQAEPQPLRVIAMQKKFALVACLKDLILPGNGFIYAERMTEGALVGLVTIPLTIWGLLNYLQLWFTDLLTNLRGAGSGAAPDFTTSDNFKMWLIGLSAVWFILRCLWIYNSVQEHNRKIAKLADINQLVAFVDGK